MTSFDEIAQLAAQWFEAAKSEYAEGRYHVAFEAFRNSAELAGKALLLRKTGRFPQEHQVTGILQKEGLVPSEVEAKALYKLLSQFTAGTYGFGAAMHKSELTDAKRVAERMMKALAKA